MPDSGLASDHLDEEIAAYIIQLMTRVESLKHIPRKGWVDREIEAPESVAAHSWRLALLSWLVAAAVGLDADKAMRIALVHDIAEVLTGDQTPFDHLGSTPAERRSLARMPPAAGNWRTTDRAAEKSRHERSAMNTILGRSVDGAGAWVGSAWDDYASASSPEAQLVHELDKIEAYLQGLEYAADGRLADPTTLTSFQADLALTVRTPVGKQLVEAVHTWVRETQAP